MKVILKISIVMMIFFIISSVSIFAQSDERKLEIAGQIRIRSENDNRDFNNDTKEIDMTLLRTRLNLNFSYSDKVIAFAQLQDSRTFGEEDTSGVTGTLKSMRNVDLHQGYIQINRLFFPWLNYKIGRMELSYGAERLIGTNPWSNVGRAFNGNVATLTFKSVQIDLIDVILYESFQAPDTAFGDGDQTLNAVWLKLNTNKSYEFEAYVINDRDEEINNEDDTRIERSTIGARFKNKFGNFNVETEINLQAGKDAFTRDILAYYASGNFGYRFQSKIQPGLTLGIDYLSGDKPSTEKYECFNTLYPAKHRYFGYMDYFTDIPKHTKNLGLTDIMAKATISPIKTMSLKTDFHLFRLSQNAILNDGSSSRDLGVEIDLTFSYDYLKNVNFSLGASGFIPGKVFKEWKKGDDPSFWLFGQTTVNF